MQNIKSLPSEFIPNRYGMHLNNLFHFFSGRFGEELSDNLFKLYKVGTSKFWINDGGRAAVFPFIDYWGNFREAKIVAYNPYTGKRIKKGEPAMIETKCGYITDLTSDKVWMSGNYMIKDRKAVLEPCFFGEHLLSDAKNVAIVESERSALIASIYLPKFTWLATGGKNGCKWMDENVFQVLSGKDVTLFPRIGSYNDWNQVRGKMSKYGIEVKTSDYLESIATAKEKEKRLDIADFLLRADHENADFDFLMP